MVLNRSAVISLFNFGIVDPPCPKVGQSFSLEGEEELPAGIFVMVASNFCVGRFSL
jgi:hypothetical protein